MRIGFFTDTYLPTGYGIQVSIETFRVDLEKQGNEVYIYTPHSPGYKDVIGRVFRFESLRIVKNPEMRLAFPILHGGKLKDATKLDLDIVHAHTPYTMWALGKNISKKQKIPMVYTHHTEYVDYTKVYLRWIPFLYQIAKWLSSSVANGADVVIAPSVKIEKRLKDFYKVKTPIRVMPTGIDTEFFGPTDESRKKAEKLRDKLGIEKDKGKMFLCLGRVDEAKNLLFVMESFIKVAKDNKQIKLVFVGDGQLVPKLKELASDADIESQVIFAGFIPEEDKPIYYQAADAYLFASHSETQGIVVLEALASGTPVVAVHDDSFAGTVEDGVNGYLIQEDSVEQFSDNIKKIIEEDDVKERFREAAIKKASNYSREKQAKVLMDIYKEAIELVS